MSYIIQYLNQINGTTLCFVRSKFDNDDIYQHLMSIISWNEALPLILISLLELSSSSSGAFSYYRFLLLEVGERCGDVRGLDETRREVQYWADIEPYVPYECLCYVQSKYMCNCVYNEQRNDVLEPNLDDVQPAVSHMRKLVPLLR